LDLEVGPEMLKRGHVDGRELVVTESQALTRVTGEKGLRTTLHLYCRSAELPDGKPMKNCGLPSVIAPAKERCSWVEDKRILTELLEAMELDLANHLREISCGSD
jgi:hypothetical protein